MRNASVYLPRLGPGIIAGVFSFALMVAFVPGWSSPASASRWILLAAFIPLGLLFLPVRRPPIWLVVFLVWCALTLVWTENRWDGADALFKLGLFTGILCIGARLERIEPVIIGLGVGVAVNALIVLAQVAGFDPVDRIAGPTGLGAGLFMNRNYLAEASALVLILAVGYRLWWLVPGCAIAVIPVAFLAPWNYGASLLDLLAMPMARGALLGLAVAALMWLWGRGWHASVAMIAALLLGMAVIPALIFPNGSFSERTIMWLSTLDGMTFAGNGLGSFYSLFPSHAPAWDFLTSRPVHAHNDWLEMAYETGLGFVAFLAWLAGAFRGPLRPERAALAAFVVMGCFGFPLHMPATLFVAALVAGRLCGARYRLRDLGGYRRVDLYDGMVGDRRARSLAGTDRRVGVSARSAA